MIGGGPAGLSAALVLSRAGRRVAVLDSGSPRNAPATHVHGFLSRDGLPPAELLAAGRAEVTGYGGTIIDGTATELLPDGHRGFRVLLADGRHVSARALLVTTGLRDELPDVPGLRARWARDVLHCPYCHGHEVRGRKLGVLGGGAGAVRYAQIVRQWSHDVVYFTPTGRLTDPERCELVARAVGIVEGDVQHVVVAEDRLRGVALGGGRVVPRDVLFVPPRFVPNSGLLAGLGCELDEHGWPVRDADGRTSVPGVWVAGNIANPRAQVVTAAGEGSTAALAVNAHLVEVDVRDAVDAFGRGHVA
ncbi:NAD(P)/FAD-dependent oxidoreductase [Kineococcus glutinatus]|uniref:NAD(P)/FAD-dependent oxidoreductase n=1 Tax=Kineococcus glutinatus TaxID=1070872 RepID=A0ABP9HRS9_9ACTN